MTQSVTRLPVIPFVYLFRSLLSNRGSYYEGLSQEYAQRLALFIYTVVYLNKLYGELEII